MITCLHIKQEASRSGIATKLISDFEKVVYENGYDSVQVLAFPDKSNWQPISLYEKLGYVRENKIGEMTLMIKIL